jgi:hypothetical protein
MVSSANSLRSLLQSNIPIPSHLQQFHSDDAVPTQRQLCWFNHGGFLFMQLVLLLMANCVDLYGDCL